MKLSDSEWIVMNVVWEKSPVTVRDVHDELEASTEWAYSTVKTILERLADKKAVSCVKRSNVGIYEPLISQKQARGSAVQSLIEKAFDGTFGSLFQHLIAEEKISKRDQNALAELLEESQRSKRKES